MLTCRVAPRCCHRLTLPHLLRHRIPHRTIASSHDPSTPTPNPTESALDAHFREAAAIAAGNLPSSHTSTSPSKTTTAPDQVPPVRRKRRRRKDDPPELDPIVADWLNHTHMQQTSGKYGSAFTPGYEPHKLLSNPPGPADVTLELLMASQAHLGHSTSLWNPANSRYIFGIRSGIHIISLDTTAQYLRRAAKVVSGVAEKGGTILFVGTRPGFDRCVVRAAQLASPAYHIFERWTPGTISNGQQILGKCGLKVVDEFDAEVDGFEDQLFERQVLKPDLVICLNPIENGAMLHECALATIPTIGVIDTDADPTWVTYPIPANDDSLRCIQVIAGVLGRAGQEGQRKRRQNALEGKITFNAPTGLELPEDFDAENFKRQRSKRKELFANGLADRLLLTSPALARAFARMDATEREKVEAGDASAFDDLDSSIGPEERQALRRHMHVRTQIRQAGEFGSLQGPGLDAEKSQAGSAGVAPEGPPPDPETGMQPMAGEMERDGRRTVERDGVRAQTGFDLRTKGDVEAEMKGDQRGDSIAPDGLGDPRAQKPGGNDKNKDVPGVNVKMSELEAKRRAAAEAYFGQGQADSGDDIGADVLYDPEAGSRDERRVAARGASTSGAVADEDEEDEEDEDEESSDSDDEDSSDSDDEDDDDEEFTDEELETAARQILEEERLNEGVGEDEGPEREEASGTGNNVESMGYNEQDVEDGEMSNEDRIQSDKVDVGNLEEGGNRS